MPPDLQRSNYPSAYVNELGQPCLLDSIVAFIDVLGFSQLTNELSSIGESQELLNKISAAIHESRQFAREELQVDNHALNREWSCKFFSDNLAFGYPLENNPQQRARAAWFLVRCAQRYQLNMALNGFFVRGALTQGAVCLTDEIIFGSALIECYQLESKTSVVPRIVLSRCLEKMLLESYRTDGGSPSIEATICRDVDGWWFVNYLQAAVTPKGVDWKLVARHKQSILDSLSHTTRHDVLSKYGWACRYHNIFCHWHRHDSGYHESHRIDRRDEESSMFKLSDHSQ